MRSNRDTPLRASIDRFERDAQGRRMAVLVFEDEQQLVVPAEALPTGSKRGDVLVLGFSPDEAETRARSEATSELQRRLFGE